MGRTAEHLLHLRLDGLELRLGLSRGEPGFRRPNVIQLPKFPFQANWVKSSATVKKIPVRERL